MSDDPADQSPSAAAPAAPVASPGGERGGAGARRKRRTAEAAAEAQAAQAAPPADEGPRENEVRIELPNFEGPLDLLLHLIQEHQLDILDIPVSFVTEKYLRYLEIMRSLSIDVASEYLVMAATLALIKSKMLLPKDPNASASADGEEEELDPREELVRRLLEYQKYKSAAGELGERATLGSDVFPRGESEPAPPGPAPFAETPVFALLDAFEKLLSRSKVKLEHQVVFDRITISDRITELVDRLRGRRTATFDELLLGPGGEAQPLTRFDLVITFLAVLEMCKLRLLRVFQAGPLEALYLELGVTEETDETERAEGAEPPEEGAPEPSDTQDAGPPEPEARGAREAPGEDDEPGENDGAHGSDGNEPE